MRGGSVVRFNDIGSFPLIADMFSICPDRLIC
jgi:hypothetical protein